MDFFSQVDSSKIAQLERFASNYYNNSYYREADICFRILLKFDETNCAYWQGLAACLKMKRDYKSALKCYAKVIQLTEAKSLDPHDFIDAADCHFSLKNIEKGLATLKKAEKIARLKNNQEILQHVCFMQKRWGK